MSMKKNNCIGYGLDLIVRRFFDHLPQNRSLPSRLRRTLRIEHSKFVPMERILGWRPSALVVNSRQAMTTKYQLPRPTFTWKPLQGQRCPSTIGCHII
ncbi:unnamed protein product [Macrosiphum euphorbiae]|uniref:Uncharacterized protein n=1 Tax=Macrosiphum euphorbiae TaxID=13131 RepID=A0AAV0XH39_9HEMI|nr:unnamed protein product [Macrosiphum euphorbiae]